MKKLRSGKIGCSNSTTSITLAQINDAKQSCRTKNLKSAQMWCASVSKNPEHPNFSNFNKTMPNYVKTQPRCEIEWKSETTAAPKMAPLRCVKFGSLSPMRSNLLSTQDCPLLCKPQCLWCHDLLPEGFENDNPNNNTHGMITPAPGHVHLQPSSEPKLQKPFCPAHTHPTQIQIHVNHTQPTHEIMSTTHRLNQNKNPCQSHNQNDQSQESMSKLNSIQLNSIQWCPITHSLLDHTHTDTHMLCIARSQWHHC